MIRFLFLLCLAWASVASAARLVWDASKTGRLMTPTNDVVLFKNLELARAEPTGCWFNKGDRRRADGARVMCNGQGAIYRVQRNASGDELTAQCQLCTEGYTKCVKIRLRQVGADVVGRVLYAKYFTRSGANKLGEDFNTLQPTAAQDVYAVLPSGRATDGYNIDWLVVKTIGSSEDNIPDATTGTMPEDEVFDWMENAVSPKVWSAYKAAHPAPFHLFGEDRKYAVRNDILPAHWFAKANNAAKLFKGTAQPGEFYPFQVCVASDKARTLRWKAETDLSVTAVTPSTCAVKAAGVKPIWVLVDIPKDAAGRTLCGTVRVTDAASGETAALPFEITVKGAVLADGGVSDPSRLARLKWLESKVGCEETVTKPYTPVTVEAATRTVHLLGRDLVLGADGLPAQIVSYFNGSNTALVKEGRKLLAQPFAFAAEGVKASGASMFAFTSVKPVAAAWRAETPCGTLKQCVEGRIDFTGSAQFRVWFEGVNGGKVSAALEIRPTDATARYFEGLGRNGGAFPGEWTHHWKTELHRDAFWCGAVNGGFAVRFKGANYRRPFVNAYYAWRPLIMPESWAAGEGTIDVSKKGAEAVIRAAGTDAPATARWNFDLYLTPFHTLDLKEHFAERYDHLGQRNQSVNLPDIRAKGATVVNIHHNTSWNPYINYPYNSDGGPFLKKLVKDAHDAGLLLKVYYTTRELTQNLPEFFALKSLDGEILAPRDPNVKGWPVTNRSGPHPWLREHVGMDLVPAWRETVNFPKFYPPRLDLAVITTPETRWDNFYLEGLDYLVKQYGIDGIYIDDTALSGASMQRARRILDRDGKRRLVDNHSWNHHSGLAGSGSSNLVFLELYPYFDLLWRGEGFSNDVPADFWLVERSGVPFGVPGEMLGRGNPFRGLLFAETDRWSWGGNPLGLWKFFDAYKLGDATMVGWWDASNPVRVNGSVGGTDEVKVTVFKTPVATVLVVANFTSKPQTVQLDLGGLKGTWTQPAIDAVQSAGTVPDLAKPFQIPARGGFVWVAQ